MGGGDSSVIVLGYQMDKMETNNTNDSTSCPPRMAGRWKISVEMLCALFFGQTAKFLQPYLYSRIATKRPLVILNAQIVQNQLPSCEVETLPIPIGQQADEAGQNCSLEFC